MQLFTVTFADFLQEGETTEHVPLPDRFPSCASGYEMEQEQYDEYVQGKVPMKHEPEPEPEKKDTSKLNLAKHEICPNKYQHINVQPKSDSRNLNIR